MNAELKNKMNMKRVAVVVLMLTVITGAQAQDAITKFFSKYQNDETFNVVTISSKMFSLFTNMEPESQEDKEVVKAISKLKGLRILQKEDPRYARELYKEAFTLIPLKEYEELMSVRDKDKDMKFFIKESSPGKISELIMIMGGSTEFMVLSLYGEIDLKEVSKIGRQMDVKGLENLEKINDKKKN